MAIDMAIDALEVAHIKGKWWNLQTHVYTCSECGKRIHAARCPAENYCSNCGADMRESRDEWWKKDDEKREKDIAEGKLRLWP